MTAYQKIPGPFMRDPKTNKIMEGMWTSPELEFVAGLPWIFTEKVDGTNIRVIWDGYRVSFAGRTDKAEIPKPLLAHLERTFAGEDKENLFEQKFGEAPAVLYGEGYGPGINGGGSYRSDVSFVLFDVLIGGLWLLRPSIEDIAEYFDIEDVPIILGAGKDATIQDAINLVRSGLSSRWGQAEAEGVVGVTKAGLRDRRGNRIIVKIKTRDFKEN
jgi:hypothetical protein